VESRSGARPGAPPGADLGPISAPRGEERAVALSLAGQRDQTA